MKILFLAANPGDDKLLRVEKELQAINEVCKEHATIKHCLNATPDNVRQLLAEYKPDFVHLSAHSSEDGIAFYKTQSNISHHVSAEELARIFQSFNSFRCVIFNTCCSEALAKAVSPFAEYVIGMRGNIQDKAAIEFTKGFYQALINEQGIQRAFELGVSAVATNVSQEESRFPFLQPRVTGLRKYVRSKYEKRGCRALTEGETLIRIFGSQRMGKSVLADRIAAYAESELRCKRISLAFHSVRHAHGDLTQLLKWICTETGRQLRLSQQVEQCWSSNLTDSENCSNYFQAHVLSSVTDPLLLVLDDIDLVFYHSDITHNLLGLLRGWCEEARSQKGYWRYLKLIVTHSRSLPRANNNCSPLANTGKDIDLRDFTPQEVLEFSRQYELNWDDNQVQSLVGLTGGHPFLVHNALDHLSSNLKKTLEQFVETAITEEDLYRSHLKYLWRELSHNPEMMKAIKQLLSTTSPIPTSSLIVENPRQTSDDLQSLGVVKEANDRLEIRCQLYRQYFLACLD